jgi:hypothetical protein
MQPPPNGCYCRTWPAALSAGLEAGPERLNSRSAAAPTRLRVGFHFLCRSGETQADEGAAHARGQ